MAELTDRELNDHMDELTDRELNDHMDELTDRELNDHMNDYEQVSTMAPICDHTLVSSQSYWDRLPTEIEHYIYSLSTWQTILDLRKRHPRRLLLEEVMDYHKLTNEWGLGHIKCSLHHCAADYCPGKEDGSEKPAGLKNQHLVVKGHYSEYLNNEETYVEFLGYSIRDARKNVSRVLRNITRKWGGEDELQYNSITF